MKVYAAFLEEKEGLFPKAINYWTGKCKDGRYATHCELWVPNHVLSNAVYTSYGVGWSSMKSRIAEVAHFENSYTIFESGFSNDFDVNKWHLIPIEVDPIKLDTFKKVFKEQISGSEYDTIGLVANGIFGIGYQVDGRWYCSELLDFALNMLGVYSSKKHQISPKKIKEKLL